MKSIKQKEKIKEPVKIRMKNLSGGAKSLYLDTYHNGKRVYEFLRLYLIPERSAFDRATNAATMRAALAIKAKRTLAIINGRAGIEAQECNYSLQDWIDHMIDAKKSQRSVSTIRLLKRLGRHISIYKESVALSDIDREFCVGFT